MKMRLFKALFLISGLLPGLAPAQVSGLPMAHFTAGGTGLTPFYVLGFELGPWQDYLARELTPDFMTTAKGLTSAYAPLSGSIVSDRVWAVLERGTVVIRDGLIEHAPAEAAGARGEP